MAHIPQVRLTERGLRQAIQHELPIVLQTGIRADLETIHAALQTVQRSMAAREQHTGTLVCPACGDSCNARDWPIGMAWLCRCGQFHRWADHGLRVA